MAGRKNKTTETTWGVTKSGVPYKEVRKDGQLFLSLGKKRRF